MPKFFGLDGEMSSADFETGGRLIQIGVASHTLPDGSETVVPDYFASLINPGEFEWNERAAAVHGFTIEDILAAPLAADVDEALVTWLAARGVTAKHRESIPVGFNVGAFDMPHVRLVLPRTWAVFSRRTLDLNALCFTLEGLAYQGTAPKWGSWKRMASTYAERILEPFLADGSLAAHDAGYDSLLHLYAWRFLRAAAQGVPLEIPQTPIVGNEANKLAGTLLANVGTERAVALTGYTKETLRGWANGGRVTDAGATKTLKVAIAVGK